MNPSRGLSLWSWHVVPVSAGFFCVFLNTLTSFYCPCVYIPLEYVVRFCLLSPIATLSSLLALFYVFAFTLNWLWQIKSSPSLVLLDAKYLPIVIFPQLDSLPHSKTNPKAAFVVKLKTKKPPNRKAR